jgi:hypothetical protein
VASAKNTAAIKPGKAAKEKSVDLGGDGPPRYTLISFGPSPIRSVVNPSMIISTNCEAPYKAPVYISFDKKMVMLIRVRKRMAFVSLLLACDVTKYIKDASRYAGIIIDIGCASTAEVVKRINDTIKVWSTIEPLMLLILFEASIMANILNTKEKLVGGVDIPIKSEYGLIDNNKIASAQFLMKPP